METWRRWSQSCFSAADDRLFVCAKKRETGLLSVSEDSFYHVVTEAELVIWHLELSNSFYFIFSGDSSRSRRHGLSGLQKKKQKKRKLCKTPSSLCCTQRHSLSGAQTYSFLSASSSSSSSSCSTETGGEPPSNPGVAKQKVTLFFGGGPLTSSSLRGLQRARCFQRMAQLLTTLWRRRHFCRNAGTLDGLKLKKYIIRNMGHLCGCKQWWNIWWGI